MKAIPNLNFLQIKAEDKSVLNFARMIQNVYQNLINVINGHIGFGDGTLPDNLDGAWVSMATGAGNVDVTLTHNLGRIPVGYIPMTKTAASDIYTGGVAATTTQITLKGSVGGVTVKLFIV